MEPAWLAWARRLNALAQTGLTFAENPYDIERYTAIRTISAEMIAHGAGSDADRVLDLFASDAGYATPKVDVRGVVFREGKILLDVGDSPADAVVREIREESGFETRATKLLALLDRNRHRHPPHVEHRHNVGMVEAGEDAGFAQVRLNILGMSDAFGVRHLDGHRTVEVFVVGQIDPSEPALTQTADDPVAPDPGGIAVRRATRTNAWRLRILRPRQVFRLVRGATGAPDGRLQVFGCRQVLRLIHRPVLDNDRFLS